MESLPEGVSQQEYDEENYIWHEKLAKGMIQRVDKKKPIDLSQYVANPQSYYSTVYPLEHASKIDAQLFQREFADIVKKMSIFANIEVYLNDGTELEGLTTYGYLPDGTLDMDTGMDVNNAYLPDGSSFHDPKDGDALFEIQKKYQAEIEQHLTAWKEASQNDQEYPNLRVNKVNVYGFENYGPGSIG